MLKLLSNSQFLGNGQFAGVKIDRSKFGQDLREASFSHVLSRTFDNAHSNALVSSSFSAQDICLSISITFYSITKIFFHFQLHTIT